uniref:Uncharacterized protein n=1 Tax=Ditylenchus dipsaci TaxID=166011 RepID=A0A915EJZ2_9BILA
MMLKICNEIYENFSVSQSNANLYNVEIEAEESEQDTKDDSFDNFNENIETADFFTNPNSETTKEAAVVQEDGLMILANVSSNISVGSNSFGKDDSEVLLKLSDQIPHRDLDYSSSEEPFVPPTPSIPQSESSLLLV